MIANTFIKRPITAIVISIVITLVGLISLIKLPVSQYPSHYTACGAGVGYLHRC